MSRILSAFALLPLLATPIVAQLTWRDAGQGLPPRAGHFAFFDDARGRVTVFGGQTGPLAYGDDLWQLDEGPWVQLTAPSGNGRAYGACCEDPAGFGTGLVFGGVDAVGTLVPTTLRWNRQTLRFDTLTPASSPPPRWITAMALDSTRRRAVLFGGGVAAGPLGDTWEWNGTGWRQAAPRQSPPARANHAMAYDTARGRIVLQGGHDGGVSRDDTWIYDGSTWTNVTPARRPGGLHNLMLAFDERRGVVVLFGGKDDGGYVHDAVWEWDGSTWRGPVQPSPRPPARELGSLTWDRQRQRIVLVGGQDQNRAALGDAWQWDGAAWIPLLPGDRGTLVEPPARFGAVLAYSEQNNRMVLFGGYNRQGLRSMPRIDTWESAGGVWQQRAPTQSPPASYAFAGAMLRGTGALCLVPGTDVFGNPYHEQWVFGSSGQWSAVPLQGTPIAPVHQVMGSLLSSHFGWVLVRVVTSGSALSQISTLQILVPNTGTVQTIFPSSGPPPLVGSVMAQSRSPSITSDRVWLFGGSYETIGGPVYTSDVWELADVGGGNLAWTRLDPAPGSPVPPPRREAAMSTFDAGVGVDRLVVVGGLGANSSVLGDVWEFDLRNRTWYSYPSLPARRSAAMTSIGIPMLFGGTDGATEFQDLWRGWPAWQLLPTPVKPWLGAEHRMAYDRGRGRLVWYGGGTTWEYDGTTWSPFVGLGQVPVGREAAAACQDEAHAKFVLFGGANGSVGMDDTHVLGSDGRWSRGALGPPARSGAAMVYVPALRRSLLFGGSQLRSCICNPGFLGDTWLYDAGADQWQPGPGGPPPRALHAMAYDRLRDRVVLFGGQDSFTHALDDTWEYHDAGGWQLRAPAHRPPARWLHTMAFDEARGRLVLSGGGPPGGPAFQDLWEWDGTDWTERRPDTIMTGVLGAAAVYDVRRARLVFAGGATSYNGLSGTQGHVDTTAELGALIDTAGHGNTANPEHLRFYSQPVLGQPLLLGFANPRGFGFHTIGFGPLQRPLAPLPVPPLCEPSSIYAALFSFFVPGIAEPNVAWTVPNTPLILGVTLVFQGFAVQPSGCWRATDALHVRF